MVATEWFDICSTDWKPIPAERHLIKPNATELKITKGEIEFKNVDFGYTSSLVLKDIKFKDYYMLVQLIILDLAP